MRHPRVRSLSTMVLAEQARTRLRTIRLTYCGGMAFRPFSDMVARTTGFRYSPKSIERAEKGESRLDGEWVLAVCAATGASIAWVMQGQGETPAFVQAQPGTAVAVEPGESFDLMDWFEEQAGRRSVA